MSQVYRCCLKSNVCCHKFTDITGVYSLMDKIHWGHFLLGNIFYVDYCKGKKYQSKILFSICHNSIIFKALIITIHI